MEDIKVSQLIGKGNRELRRIVEWQVVKYGKEFRLVNPRDTSRKCSRCGYVNEKLTLRDRVFRCLRCGLVIDRDLNASINILKRGGGWEPAQLPVEPRPIPLVPQGGQGEAMKQKTPP
ncbi:transposase [Vulcanisaeta souniana]|uniref:transposase n=1 Tax=Vulcanisaeta souniana TaxID=164452 RepID=UPI000B0B5D8D|nr:transposase [Vulcanisaeta souniana]